MEKQKRRLVLYTPRVRKERVFYALRLLIYLMRNPTLILRTRSANPTSPGRGMDPA